MRAIFVALVLAATAIGAAAADAPATIPIPDGFVAQKLDATDGLIARPKDWHYESHGTPSGWMWTISKEDPAAGPYETGMRIQLFIGIRKGTGRSPEEFAKSALAQLRQGVEVVSECNPTPYAQFMRQCLEVRQTHAEGGHPKPFHIQYSVFWGADSKMDIAVVTTFGAPDDEWEANKSIGNAMSVLELFGPNFGKDASGQTALPAH